MKILNSPFSLKSKKILITGASSGIGRECAILCSKMGAEVILIARNEERLNNTFSQLHGDGHQLIVCDITKYAELAAIVDSTVSDGKKITGFIHSAGIELTKPLKMMKTSDYEDIFSINVFAGYELAKIISNKKYSDDAASFIFISSIMGIVSNSALTAYSSTKGALISGCRSMAIELSKRRIRVNTISPGYIKTKLLLNTSEKLSIEQLNVLEDKHLLGLGTPDDVANASVFLLSDASKWVTATNLIVDGGYSAR